MFICLCLYYRNAEKINKIIQKNLFSAFFNRRLESPKFNQTSALEIHTFGHQHEHVTLFRSWTIVGIRIQTYRQSVRKKSWLFMCVKIVFLYVSFHYYF